VLGSDPYGAGIIPGFANHLVIENLVRGGFAPLEAIRIATLEGARFLKIQERVGSVAVGKQADLLVVRGDPSVSIADLENVDIVFKGGIGYDPVTLLAAVRGTVGWR
jgi:imidazolonepropionase-like amidohydrolase